MGFQGWGGCGCRGREVAAAGAKTLDGANDTVRPGLHEIGFYFLWERKNRKGWCDVRVRPGILLDFPWFMALTFRAVSRGGRRFYESNHGLYDFLLFYIHLFSVEDCLYSIVVATDKRIF